MKISIKMRNVVKIFVKNAIISLKYLNHAQYAQIVNQTSALIAVLVQSILTYAQIAILRDTMLYFKVKIPKLLMILIVPGV